MKILKPGKVEMRKFVCPNCECEFVIYKSEADRAIDMEANYHYWAKCLCRDQIAWEKGDPYEEPMQDDTARLSKLIADCPISLTALGVSASQTLRFADYLTENGVTFREG